MDRGNSPNGSSLDRWSPLAFLGAGGLLLGHAALLGLQAFTTVTPPPDVFAPAGHLLALVGVLGVFRVFTDRSPGLAWLGSVVTAVVAVGWIAVTIAILGGRLGNPSPQTEALLGVLAILVLVSTVLPYGLIGVIALRSAGTPRGVGLLLLAPATLLVVLLANVAILGVTPIDGVLIATALALAMLAVGHTLRTRGVPADRTSPERDVAPA